MKKIFPYLAIAFLFSLLILFKHTEALTYRFDQKMVSNYLRSQDIEDPEGKIKNRIFVSDSDIYQATGYLYAKGEDPQKYNIHPPLIKYLFGFSILLTGNPFVVQIILGLALLFLTYFLGIKVFKNTWIAFLGVALLLPDPVFGGMMDETLLDLGQAVFALTYIVLIFFYPERYILSGVFLGLLSVSKFWSTAAILVVLVYGYRLLRKEKINYRKTALSLLIALVVFVLVYTVSIFKGGPLDLLEFQGRVLKFMLTHNSAATLAGGIILFFSGFFSPWWQEGVVRSNVWTFIWPMGMIASVFLALISKIKNANHFFYLFPLIYLILTSTQVPFVRYFILILPFIYLNLAKVFVDLFISWYKMGKWKD